jgi:Immunity protein 8
MGERSARGAAHARGGLQADDRWVRATLREIVFDPDPMALPADPEAFAFQARLMVGPSRGCGQESFDVTMASPQWLAARCREQGGILHARHHVIVNPDTFDQRRLRAWFHQQVSGLEADTWRELGMLLSRLGYWEFEDYQERPS